MAKNLTIVHVSDLHIRGRERHAEYRDAFDIFVKKVKTLAQECDGPCVVVLTGDLFHTKTLGLTAEYIALLSEFLTNVASVCTRVIVTLGNHDGIIGNASKLDAVSPIVRAMNNDSVRVYVKSGVYDLLPDDSEYRLCVFSPFDKERWDDVTPVTGCANIATFHGPVNSAVTSIGWVVSESDVDVEMFDGFDATLLGDIHAMQTLKKNSKKISLVAYAGSLIQQDYGESVNGHGFLVWRFVDKSLSSVDFIEVENVNPLVTLRASHVEEDLEKSVPDRDKIKSLRVRVRSENQLNIAQANDIKERVLKYYLAFEVVFDTKSKTVADVSQALKQAKSLNLRDQATLKSLYEEQVNDELTPRVRRLADAKLQRVLDTVCVQDDEMARGTIWSLKKLAFNNTFAFGESNVIDFSELRGVTAIVGPNGSGKSSFLGTMIVSLFNATDRGSIRPYAIINDNSDDCSTLALIGSKGEEYLIERSISRKKNDRTQTRATLQVTKTRERAVVNLRGDSRTDTEKVVRNLIGTSQDFLRTSMSAQGDVENQLAYVGSAERFRALSRFIDLGALDEVYQKLNGDSNALKNKLKPYAECEQQLSTVVTECEQLQVQEQEIRLEIDKVTGEIVDLKTQLSDLGDGSQLTENDLKTLDQQLAEKKHELKTKTSELSEIERGVVSQEQLTALEEAASSVDPVSVAEQRGELHRWQLNIESSNRRVVSENRELDVLDKSVSLLKSVPCGDVYLDCKFIKDAHQCKAKLPEQQRALDEAMSKVKEVVNGLKELGVTDERELSAKIKKLEQQQKDGEAIKAAFNAAAVKKTKVVDAITKLKSRIATLESEIPPLEKKREEVQEALNSETVVRFKTLRGKLSSAEGTLSREEGNSRRLARLLGAAQQKRADLEKKVAEKVDLIDEATASEVLADAFSRKGIPSKIISRCVPLLNAEIAAMLDGVTDFTVELSIDDDSSSVDIDLVCGPIRRPIETTCGMERFYSQLAVRCALISLSSLPKCDTFIIDEGFGSLDARYVVNCTEFLKRISAKFGRVIIVTHVEAIRDSVDRVIEMTRVEGKASIST